MLRSRTMSGSDVTILFGGTSNERRVSVASAQNVSAVLDEAEAWFLAPSGAVHRVAREELAGFQRPFERDFLSARPAEFPSVVAAFESQPSRVYLLALHGGEGEDGTIQRMLEARRIAFTGPGAAASARRGCGSRTRCTSRKIRRSCATRCARCSPSTAASWRSR